MELSRDNFTQLDFSKSSDGLLPAVVQDASSRQVLMLGYVNAESLAQSFETGYVTFYSRSKKRLWTKGESSGNTLTLTAAYADCDRDAVLMFVEPKGPTCHTGTTSCFQTGDKKSAQPTSSAFAKTDSASVEDLEFLRTLEDVLRGRQPDANSDSYTSRLLAKGIMKVAQKVGEEGVEVALEAVGGTDELLLEEAADLMYHYLLLLRAKGQQLSDVVKVLRKRHE